MSGHRIFTTAFADVYPHCVRTGRATERILRNDEPPAPRSRRTSARSA